MVKWSPSVMGLKHRRTTMTLIQLYPPFLERGYQDPWKWKETLPEPNDVDAALQRKLKFKSSIGVSTIQSPTERFAEIRDTEDYQSWEDSFEEEETYRAEEKKETKLSWSLERCKTYSPLSKPNEEPDTTDPFLSHELYLPYSLTPQARNFMHTIPEAGYHASALPRRPRSPVRTLLPGKFDLSAAYEERNKQRRVSETREQLREIKNRISQSIKQLPFDWPNVDLLICSLILQAMCEEVTMTQMDITIDPDIHTFVNAAVVWALRDIDVFGYEILVEQEFLLLSHFEYCNFEREVDVSDMVKPNGTRRMLLSAFRAPFSRSNWETLHRQLSWSYVCPSHEKGHTKFYPNIHERINETLPQGEDAVNVSPYVPDLTCYHFGDVTDKSHVAYRRKSKFAIKVPKAAQIVRALLTDLVNVA